MRLNLPSDEHVGIFETDQDEWEIGDEFTSQDGTRMRILDITWFTGETPWGDDPGMNEFYPALGRGLSGAFTVTPALAGPDTQS